MTDPTEHPDHVGASNVAGNHPVETGNPPGRKPERLLGWIIAIMIVVLIVWAFVGMRHRTEVAPAVQSPAAPSTAH